MKEDGYINVCAENWNYQPILLQSIAMKLVNQGIGLNAPKYVVNPAIYDCEIIRDRNFEVENVDENMKKKHIHDDIELDETGQPYCKTCGKYC